MKNLIQKLCFFFVLLGINTVGVCGNGDVLTAACKKGDLAGVQKALAEGADVNAKNSEGWNPISASFFWPEITQLLLDKGADVGALNNAALGSAARTASFKTMEILLKAGADPNTTNTGASPLQYIVTYTSCKECMELLISKGAKTDVINPNTKGNLLDDLAMSYLFGKEKADNEKPQVGGWEKMGFAVPDWYRNQDTTKYGTPDEMVKILVKAGVNINAENKLKNTPLLTSLGRYKQTRAPLVLAFINNGANVNVEGYAYKGPALLQAAGYGFVDVIDAMFAKGADMNMEFKVNDPENGQRLKGITPLMWAARNGKLDAVKYLNEKGAKINEAAFGNSFNIKTQCMTTVKNKTTIFYAIEGENPEVVKYLVENTSGDWKGKLIVDKWKKERQDAQFIYQSCIDDKEYKASEYAKACGLYDIADYLKSRKL